MPEEFGNSQKKGVPIKNLIFVMMFIGFLCLGNPKSIAQQGESEKTIFETSLHQTSRGMGYWYDKANGGLETITGIPYSQLTCKNCHVASCDQCHGTKRAGVPTYTTESARNQEICLSCHKREASIMQIDAEANQQDVHAESGMECMGCHTAREVHGDGIEYVSMKQPGAMDTQCAACHSSVTQSLSHSIHGQKLDCKACHERHVVSCTNCHFETILREDKRVAIPKSGWVFLMNYQGKVTSANMQSFVASGPKTFLMFAPQHSHSIMNEGRTCDQCHATDIVNKVMNGNMLLTWLEQGEVKNTEGVIPVADGVRWDLVYQDYQDGKWIEIKDAPDPEIQYAGFGSPLSKEQMKGLATPQRQPQ